MYPILEWLLSRIPDLKTRAYLAKYLVKIEVVPEVIADPDVSDLYKVYEDLINQFKDEEIWRNVLIVVKQRFNPEADCAGALRATEEYSNKWSLSWGAS